MASAPSTSFLRKLLLRFKVVRVVGTAAFLITGAFGNAESELEKDIRILRIIWY